MKNVSNVCISIMVFMMAIAFAFASTSTTKTEDAGLALVPGYIMIGTKCEHVTICDTGGLPCLFNGVIVRTKINDTQCGLQLFRTFW